METGIVENKIAGDMIRTTVWFGRIGWIAFLITLISFFLYVLIDVNKETPVLAYDKDTHTILGEIQWFQRPRSEDEIIVDVMRWGRAYFSQNSADIFPQAALALSAMSPELKNSVMASWDSTSIQKQFGTNYLAYISGLQQRSEVHFQKPTGVEITRISQDQFQAQLRGSVIVDPLSGNVAAEVPFDAMITFATKNYSIQNTLGLMITEIKDN